MIGSGLQDETQKNKLRANGKNNLFFMLENYEEDYYLARHRLISRCSFAPKPTGRFKSDLPASSCHFWTWQLLELILVNYRVYA
jgi:hypothetical protein